MTAEIRAAARAASFVAREYDVIPSSVAAAGSGVESEAWRIERGRPFALPATLADSDNLFGPQRVIPIAHDQVNLMQQLRRSSRGADLQDLVGVQTEFADLLGWLHQDGGDHHAAQFWLDRALEWSHLS